MAKKFLAALILGAMLAVAPVGAAPASADRCGPAHAQAKGCDETPDQDGRPEHSAKAAAAEKIREALERLLEELRKRLDRDMPAPAHPAPAPVTPPKSAPAPVTPAPAHPGPAPVQPSPEKPAPKPAEKPKPAPKPVEKPSPEVKPVEEPSPEVKPVEEPKPESPKPEPASPAQQVPAQQVASPSDASTPRTEIPPTEPPPTEPPPTALPALLPLWADQFDRVDTRADAGWPAVSATGAPSGLGWGAPAGALVAALALGGVVFTASRTPPSSPRGRSYRG